MQSLTPAQLAGTLTANYTVVTTNDSVEPMLLSIFLLLVGFIAIIWSADQVVLGASSIARAHGISPLLIGLTIVALGTSAPEIVVSITASLRDKPGLAVGNAIGSNIANIGLVLGLTALLSPLSVQSQTLKREYPIMFLIMLVSFYFISDGTLSQFEGVLLLLGLLCLMVFLAVIAKREQRDSLAQEFQQAISQPVSYPAARLLVGLVGLPLSAQCIVQGGVGIATLFGMSDTLIGLTIIAVGTSLPEAATSISGALKGEDDIAVGNVIGSNMFNLLAVLPFASVKQSASIAPTLIYRDFSMMAFLSVLLLLLIFRRPRRLDRIEGLLLFMLYIGYLLLVIRAAA